MVPDDGTIPMKYIYIERDPTIYLHDAKASGGDCMSGLCFT